jgi:hypothetical protein
MEYGAAIIPLMLGPLISSVAWPVAVNSANDYYSVFMREFG